MNKKHKAAVAALLLTITLIVIPAAYGVQPDNAGVLYSTYLDWLQGKPVGLASLSVEPQGDVEKATLAVIDYTFGRPRTLYVGPLETPTVKIKRVAVGTKRVTVLENGRPVEKLKTLYHPVTLLVIVSGKNHWGAKVVQFSPEKPMTHITVRMRLHKGGSATTVASIREGFSVTTEPLGPMRMKNVKIFRLHSVPGVEERVEIGKNDMLAIDSFSQTTDPWTGKPDPDGWERAGRVNTPFGSASPVPTSNGQMKTVYATVRYSVDTHTVCGYLICRTVYTLIPKEIEEFSKIETGTDPGRIPSNLVKLHHYQSSGDSLDVYFQEDHDDGGVYFSSAVSACIGEGFSICFTGNINTYRSSKAYVNRPVIKVVIHEWKSRVLYYAKYSSNGNYYEVYLQWG